jgi:DnaK suppressor protein
MKVFVTFEARDTVRKIEMPLAADKIAHYREVLMDQREKIIGQVESLAKDVASSTEATENSKSPINIAENASDSYEQDFAFMSMESEEEILRKIELALRHIRDGTYGKCEDCEEDIPNERLDILPFAVLCLKCQQINERRGGRRGDDEEDETFEALEELDDDNPTGDDRA